MCNVDSKNANTNEIALKMDQDCSYNVRHAQTVENGNQGSSKYVVLRYSKCCKERREPILQR